MKGGLLSLFALASVALSASPSAFTPGLSISVRLHGVAPSDAKLDLFRTKLASLVGWSDSLVSQVSAVNTTPDGASLSAAQCPRVKLSGLPGYAGVSSGYYERLVHQHNLRPAYQGPGASYLYMVTNDAMRSFWAAGPTLGGDQAAFLVESNAASPQEALGLWKGFNNGWKDAPDLKVACAPYPITQLVLRFAPQDCSSLAALEALQAPISTELHRNGLIVQLRNLGLTGLNRIDYAHHHLRGCEPLIKLGWAGKPHSELAVHSCKFEGGKIKIEHASRHAHNSFACSHKQDKETQEWKCHCRSWTDTTGGTSAPLGAAGTPAPTYAPAN